MEEEDGATLRGARSLEGAKTREFYQMGVRQSGSIFRTIGGGEPAGPSSFMIDVVKTAETLACVLFFYPATVVFRKGESPKHHIMPLIILWKNELAVD